MLSIEYVLAGVYKGTEKRTSLRGKNWVLWECDPKNRSLTKGRVFPCGPPDCLADRRPHVPVQPSAPPHPAFQSGRQTRLSALVHKQVEFFPQLIQERISGGKQLGPVSFLAVGQ